MIDSHEATAIEREGRTLARGYVFVRTLAMSGVGDVVVRSLLWGAFVVRIMDLSEHFVLSTVRFKVMNRVSKTRRHCGGNILGSWGTFWTKL